MKRLLKILLTLSIFAAGCQSGEQTTPVTGPTAGKFPVVVEAQNGNITITKRPIRIISLSSTATEILFAVKAGSQVVAVDDQSNYPESVPKTDLSGFTPNVEAIASYKPDLVVHSSESGDLTKSLESLNIPVIVQPAAKGLEDTYEQIKQLGSATGHVDVAAQVVGDMKASVRRILAGAPKFDKALTYYHELDNTFFTATSKTFIGEIYGLLGLKNIADSADKDAGGYPQLSAEFIIQANPDLIFLADTKYSKESAETVAKRPGWDKINAVSNGGVVAVDDDVASRWGPRVVDFLSVVSEALTAAKAKAA